MSVEGVNPSEIEDVVDRDIREFNSYFQDELKNEPLTKPEWAAIKTYLWWRLLNKK